LTALKARAVTRRRVRGWICAAVIVFVFVGCGDDSGRQTPTTGSDEPMTTTTPSPEGYRVNQVAKVIRDGEVIGDTRETEVEPDDTLQFVTIGSEEPDEGERARTSIDTRAAREPEIMVGIAGVSKRRGARISASESIRLSDIQYRCAVGDAGFCPVDFTRTDGVVQLTFTAPGPESPVVLRARVRSAGYTDPAPEAPRRSSGPLKVDHLVGLQGVEGRPGEEAEVKPGDTVRFIATFSGERADDAKVDLSFPQGSGQTLTTRVGPAQGELTQGATLKSSTSIRLADLSYRCVINNTTFCPATSEVSEDAQLLRANVPAGAASIVVTATIEAG
jgi:hypothetical protein